MERSVSGKHCPNCREDIGTFAIMKAGLPNLIKCPHCKEKLKFKPFPFLLVGVLTLIYFFCVLWLSPPPLNATNIIILCVLAYVLWQPFEYIIAKYLRAKSQLHLK